MNLDAITADTLHRHLHARAPRTPPAGPTSHDASDRGPMHRLLLALQDTAGWLVAAAALFATIHLCLRLGQGG
jgi:hypothetical protein